MEKDTDVQYRAEQYKHSVLAKENLHNGFILHKADINKVEDKHMFEIQGDRRMKYMNVFFSVSEDYMNKIRKEMDPKHDTSTDEHQRSIIRIMAQKRPELTSSTFISQREKLVRLSRKKPTGGSRFVSPEQRIGTQFNSLRSSKNSIVPHVPNPLQLRPETEKHSKRLLSSGLSTSKQSTQVPSKILRGFGISVRTLYGKHTPMNFSNMSGLHTPNEYADTSKSWLRQHRIDKLQEEGQLRARVAKAREIGKIMKKLGEAEMDRNLQIFKGLIKEEKQLYRELVELDRGQRQRELISKKAMKRRSMARLEREFAKTFAQHKNVISKHASIGEKRRRENEYVEKSTQNYKKMKLTNIKHQKGGSMSTNRSYLKAQRYSLKPSQPLSPN